jgi:carotenoid 1,2-hydratase
VVGTQRRALPAAGPGFDARLNPGGYAWWYLDALSDDGRWGLCLIAFLGSSFSPYYAAARRRAAGEPLDHCALNVALTGPVNRWSMTERPHSDVARDTGGLVVGPSSLRREGDAYVARIAERCCPLPHRLRGTVRITPLSTPGVCYPLDRAGHHHWTPLAPQARVAVEFSEPAVRWSGQGYLDSNRGDRPLEHDYRGWAWSRTTTHTGTTVFYDPQHREESAWPLALHLSRTGRAEPVAAPDWVRLPASRWGIGRAARSEDATATQLVRTWVDAPFYVRTHLQTRLDGRRVATLHESLDLDRFKRRWVQWLLPFRMPRRRAQRKAPSPVAPS